VSTAFCFSRFIDLNNYKTKEGQRLKYEIKTKKVHIMKNKRKRIFVHITGTKFKLKYFMETKITPVHVGRAKRDRNTTEQFFSLQSSARLLLMSPGVRCQEGVGSTWEGNALERVGHGKGCLCDIRVTSNDPPWRLQNTSVAPARFDRHDEIRQ